MSAKISISVNLSNPINWETNYQSLAQTIQNVVEKVLFQQIICPRLVYRINYFFEASIACSTSLIISSICSIPTEILIKSSLTPAKAFCSGVNCLCNVDAG